ncbi:MAG: hypothetical protein ABW221_07345 [Vicinamibacteria bacterium]
MVTFEDAAEELVVKLRGLDAEIEESDRKLEALKERMIRAKDDLGEDWDDLADAVQSLLEKVHDEGEQLKAKGDQALQAVADAHGALEGKTAEARHDVELAAGQLDALGQHAAAVDPAVESLVEDALEHTAHALEQQVRELEQQLGALLDGARDFLTNDVLPSVERLGEDVGQRCAALARALTEDHAGALQEAFAEWSAQLDQLEGYVLEQAYATSRQHAQGVVEYATEAWQTESRARLDDLTLVVSLLEGELRHFADEAERAGRALVEQGGERLVRELDEARTAAERAVSGLDRVMQELAARSFTEG